MRQFGVSRGTVQRVLAQLSAQGILKREQGRGTFRLASSSTSMPPCKTLLVGVWFNLPRGPMWSPALEAIRRELDRWGYHAVYEEGGLAIGAEGRGIASLVRKPLDGFIVAPSHNPGDDHHQLEAVISRNIPIVMVDRLLPGYCTDLVTTTNELGAEQLINHLIDLGHRRIGFIGMPGMETVDDRANSYRSVMQERGLAVRSDWVRMTEKTCWDCGLEAANQILSLPADVRPTALFGANDYIAETCAMVAQDRGLKVPQDLSIVGFDDSNPLPEQMPRLTTYSQPKQMIGQQAARLLMKRIADPSRHPVVLVLEGKLVVRQSTGPPPRF